MVGPLIMKKSTSWLRPCATCLCYVVSSKLKCEYMVEYP